MKYPDYPEQQKHGTPDFPYFFYHVTSIHPRYNMPYHWHPLCEIVHVYSGHFRLHLENDELELGPGDSVFISSGVTHGGCPLETKDCCYECLLLDIHTIFKTSPPTKIYEPHILDFLNEDITIQSYFPASMHEENKAIQMMLNCICEQSDGSTLLLQAATFLFFGLILKNHRYSQKDTLANNKKDTAFKKVFSFISNHYGEDITLSQLSSCANMNSHYFCHYFKKITHRTPMDYLNYYRIEVACELLIYSQKNITEIAYECGFQDASYFCKVFKRYKDITPSEYLKSKRFITTRIPTGLQV